MGWSILIGNQGGVLADYSSYADFDYVKQLYDIGIATLILTGVDGNAAPAKGMVLKFIFDKGLPTEQVRWEGIIAQADKKQQGNIFIIRAFTPEALTYIAQTGVHRNYLALTPHAIIQGGAAPANLLTDSQATLRLSYGASAAVPNKVDGGTPGVVLAQFVADSTSLFNNIRRLCMQSRYGDGSYGLEWQTTMEGANLSTPTFYLVKRRERAAVYVPEVFNIPNDFENARRGTAQFPGVDAVKIIGAGNGKSRIESAIAGAGTRELVIEDKAIFQQVNADNFANRTIGIYGTTVEVITAVHHRHTSPSRVGDTVTVQQAGVADANLRMVMEHYSLSTKTFMVQLGRPTPVGRDNFQALLGIQRGGNTTPQFTDLIVPGQFDRAVMQVTVFHGAAAALAIPADTQAVGALQAIPASGDVEEVFMHFFLNLDAASAVNPGPIVLELFAFFDGGPAVSVVQVPFSGNLRPQGAGAFAGTYTIDATVPFKLNDPTTNSTNITGWRVDVFETSGGPVTIKPNGTGCFIYLKPKHRHNEQL